MIGAGIAWMILISYYIQNRNPGKRKFMMPMFPVIHKKVNMGQKVTLNWRSILLLWKLRFQLVKMSYSLSCPPIISWKLSILALTSIDHVTALSCPYKSFYVLFLWAQTYFSLQTPLRSRCIVLSPYLKVAIKSCHFIFTFYRSFYAMLFCNVNPASFKLRIIIRKKIHNESLLLLGFNQRQITLASTGRMNVLQWNCANSISHSN